MDSIDNRVSRKIQTPDSEKFWDMWDAVWVADVRVECDNTAHKDMV